MNPCGFCTFATNNVKHDLRLFLYSLSYSNPASNIIIFVDSEIEKAIKKEWNELNLNIHIVNNLNQYSNKTREQMEEEKIWTDFQMIKSSLIEYSLTLLPDILYLDSDIFIINKIELPMNDKKQYDLALSPHYINKRNTNGVGFFNGGVVWTNNIDFPKKWKEYTKTSRYFDQASLEDCDKHFKTAYFGENYNFSWWRLNDSEEPSSVISSYLTYNDENVYYKNKPLIFVHTHFTRSEPHFLKFNLLILNVLNKCKSMDYLSNLLIT